MFLHNNDANVFIPPKLLVNPSFINLYFHLHFVFYSHRPLLSPTVSPTVHSHNKHSPSSALRCTLTIVSCTVYWQGDKYAQTLLTYLHLKSSTSSPSACPTPSTSFSFRSVFQLAYPTTTLPHLLLPHCLLCFPLHLNSTVPLSQQTFIGFLHNTLTLAVYIVPYSSPRFRLSTLWRHPYQS